ncbi:DedA family protein [Patescibacteria group bacterium]|nr:MAG: DedA family protein [Patescibacteria group bacterium]
MFDFLDPTALIQTLGILGVFVIVFAESGLFFGFFFPGDSLLFTAGLLASQGYFDIYLLVFGCVISAVLGDSVGYAFGKHAGDKIFTREDSLFFHKKHVLSAQIFYEKHGKKAIVLARFVPIVRTFAPILAGVGKMQYRTFLAYNIIGGVLWVVGLSLLGFVLGNTIPDIDRYILPIVVVIIIGSFVPMIVSYVQNKKSSS